MPYLEQVDKGKPTAEGSGIIPGSYLHEKSYLEALDLIGKAGAWSFGGPAYQPDQAAVQTAMNVFLKAIDLDPEFPGNYVSLGHISQMFLHDDEGALAWYIKAVLAAPYYRGEQELNEGYRYIRELRNMNKGAKENSINRKIDAFVHAFSKTHPDCAGLFEQLAPDDVRVWIKSDIRGIVATARRYGVKVILQNYPVVGTPNKTLKDMGRELGVVFVDHQKIFQDKLKQGSKWEEFFVPDGHCNAVGYRIMARNLYYKILEEHMLKSAK